MTTGVASTCPQCGAPLRFGGGASLAVVCGYCRFAVLRTGARLDVAGKVPDLVATDTRLSVGTAGKVQGKTFILLGRLQLSQGEAVWNEWYASFGDASWGWVAEAQGRLYVTFPVSGATGLPPRAGLSPGQEIQLPQLGRAVVDEVNQARLISFEGELPVTPELGERWSYADCSTASGGFATLDYGSGEEPVLYAGREESYAEAGLQDCAPIAIGRAEKARALSCPNCGGPIELRRTDSKAFACPSCGALLDVSGGAFEVLGVLERRSRPPIPLGAKGTLLGENLEVLGFLVRCIQVDGEQYSWQEFLLHGGGGYRWLTVYNGHWLFLHPIAAAKVALRGRSALCDGRAYKHFQGAQAQYLEIQGEFYWEIRAGDTVRTDDYVSPPFLLSQERTEQEASWSQGQSVKGDDVWKAFKLPAGPPPVVGVGQAQPNPYLERLGHSWKVAGLALLALLLLSAVTAARAPRQEVLALDVPLTPGDVTLSEPFELLGGPQAVEITAEASVSQAWVGLDVALIEDETGESETVAFELSHFFGVEEGEAWSEGSRHGSAVIGSVKDGRYVLRAEPQIERGNGQVPPTAHLRVVRGVFLMTPLLVGLLLVAGWPIFLLWRSAAFERRRWQDSDHPWGSSG